MPIDMVKYYNQIDIGIFLVWSNINRVWLLCHSQYD